MDHKFQENERELIHSPLYFVLKNAVKRRQDKIHAHFSHW